MTFVEMYEAQPHDVQSLVENYSSNLDWAADCFETLLTICPEKESSVRALAEAYASYYHQQMSAEDRLKEMGYSDKDITHFGYGYQLKYRKE